MTVEMNVFFKMQQKDDKKEILKFEIKGSDSEKKSNSLYELAGSIIVFKIEGCAAGEVTAEFMNIQRDSKKTALKFAIKGDSEEKAQELYKYAGQNVKIEVNPSQMTLDEFYGEEDDEGIEYTVDNRDNVEVNPDQVRLEDYEVEAEQEKIREILTDSEEETDETVKS
ncbi:hypothetical protein [Fictibacillus nanhaiensis]|uniref:hypothetical protein n=1 Tax=Fictibacillus nanhaiensis TaxID=742169 RepID=UPI003C200470